MHKPDGTGGTRVYARLFNRLTGWLYFVTGMAGLFTTHWGSYMRFSPSETALHIALGLLAMSAARGRLRGAAVGALWIGLCSLLWGIWGLAWPISVLGGAEPVENAVHFVIGLWGLYVAVHDVSEWRRIPLRS